MKTIRLCEAMKSLVVTINHDGYTLKSPAGEAYYDVWGVRGKVNGIPEYFPVTLLLIKHDAPQGGTE